MSPVVAQAALKRAVASLAPGGLLELGFFGGEPLLEGSLVGDTIEEARLATQTGGLRLRLNLTTNGTIVNEVAWQVMLTPDLDLHISHDGLPAIHDRHRRGADGRGSSAQVLRTILRLQQAGREPRVVMVVRPDTVAAFPRGIAWLRDHGISHVDPSLDIWATWTVDDARLLEAAIAEAAEVWREGLPHCSVGWFDEKAARIAALPTELTARCGYGDGQIAVAPSGNLYPCERVLGVDAPDNRARLPGHAFDDGPFRPQPLIAAIPEECACCAIQAQCATSCRCSNFIRTGDPWRPDGLLCLLDRVCFRETARVLRTMQQAAEASLILLQEDDHERRFVSVGSVPWC
jgi:uncharacterized protein